MIRRRLRTWRVPPRAAAAVVLLAACSGALVQGADVPANRVDENHVKAAFLFNFAKFVQWPQAPDGPFVIGVAGERSFSELMERMVQGRAINGRELTARRLAYGDDPAGCHVLFISGSRQREAADMLLRTRGSILTVGETVQFLRDGGMVRFYVEDNRVRFQINQKNAEAVGLKVSSQLLTLAAR